MGSSGGRSGLETRLVLRVGRVRMVLFFDKGSRFIEQRNGHMVVERTSFLLYLGLQLLELCISVSECCVSESSQIEVLKPGGFDSLKSLLMSFCKSLLLNSVADLMEGFGS